MRNKIAALTLAALLTAAPVFASPTEFAKGSVSLELGSTINAKVSGQGRIAADVNGKTGFKFSVTAGMSDNLSLQYKQGFFKSEDSTIAGITTYAQAEPRDVNVLYKLSPALTLVAGYEHTKISYGKAVADASRSAPHIGLTATQRLNDRSTLFATVLGGKNVSLKEIGISYAMTDHTALNVSYAERTVNNVELHIPALGVNSKEDYKMKGITCLLNYRF